ncbi:hypothetical protein NUW58_g10164 [Xylaria curta]|uniref:Uncharacterized protein n=1 Tax=Xylaria curta TaxID=42375 RepID=A0ACC1MQ24_9PEZI|nr:hypothetical protein NUW58_g10164 [Xylaria curta]
MAQAAPFEERDQLCSELEIVEHNHIRRRQLESSPTHNAARMETLPGDPRISLTEHETHELLEDELITDELNKLAPHFWLITTQSSKNVMSLTEQAVQGRKITVTENPGLHLVWLNQRIFIKPVPKYLMSHAFWTHYLLSTTSPIQQDKRIKLIEAAQGFLRSYAYLIQHESDFRMATDDNTRLIPSGISYTGFVTFIAGFKRVDDTFVSPRYQVGELRLKRLNFWIKFYAPFLFTFALFSLIMSAMQLVLAVRTVPTLDASWLIFARAADGFALFIVFLVAVVIAFFLITLVGMMAAEINYALRDLYRKRKEKQAPQDEEHRPSTPQANQ